ncbi:MAG: AzlD domain-containing protein, partial [Burkholderiales bacterium]|nr:AzlD domain-containing protein [Burkholderiales bacterium]
MTTFLLLILGLALTSFIPRASFILLFARWPAPALLRRALRYVPAAVFSAILVPGFVLTAGSIHIALDNPRLLAGILAGIV